MCGISGFVCRGEPRPGVVSRMCSALHHRGPDDTGTYEFHKDGLGIALGHTRLSIIDVEGGHQPILNEDGALAIVHNGEIYNYKQLRQGLIGRGHTFKTESDAESILHLYEEEGVECLQQLRGMFAFALWDGNEGRLFLARDRLGQKPLVYAEQGGVFVFASEINAVLQFPGMVRRVRPQSISSYLTYQYVPHPHTAFEGIRKLPPAHYLILKDGRSVVKRYWLPEAVEDASLREEECIERIRALVEESVRLRLVSDVPLGAFLSGGVDSSIVVGLMSRAMDEPVQTFSIGFEEERYNELPYARLVARKNEARHREFVVRPDAVRVLPELVWHFGEPFADSSAIPTYYVAQMTSDFVKAALTGEGGDESFAGYPRYQAMRIGLLFDRLPRFIRQMTKWHVWGRTPPSVGKHYITSRARKLLSALALPPYERYYFWVSIFDELSKTALCTDDFLRQAGEESPFDFLAQYYELASRADILTATMFVDIMTYLPCDLLTKVDVSGMIHSLEVRSPFLDHRLMEFALQIPWKLKLRMHRGKYVLKRAFRDVLPGQVLRRGKKGFGVPVSEWMRKDFSDLLRDVLLDKRTLRRGYFKPKGLQALVEEHVHGRADHGERLWALLFLEMWHRQYIDPPEQPEKMGL